ncbi:MAG: MFS transporter [Actinomycetota bacterium]|nr:MFS transporter [Actinomycetota bacterium]
MPRSPRTPANGGRPRSGTSNGRPAETGDNITNGNPLLGVGVNGGPLPGGASGPGGPAAGGHGHDDRYKWIALSNTTLGILMAVLNSSIVLIAMPAIFRGIGLNPLAPSNTSYLLWMLMGFMVVTAVLVVSLGRIGDMFGRVRMYNLGFAVFTLFSILLSITWLHGTSAALYLIVLRIGQGVGGALLMANSSAILTDAFPSHQRGLAMGINNVAMIAGSFIGLILGGVLAPVEWRLVFLVSVPFGLFGTVWAYLKLRDTGVRTKSHIDWWGNLTFAAGLIMVLVGITYGLLPYGGHTMGWTSPFVLVMLFGGLAILVLFGYIETKVAQPMFHLDLFRIRAFAMGNAANLLASLSRGGLMFIIIIWLQGIWLPQHGYAFDITPLWAGIYMVPLTVGFLIAGPTSGFLADRFGARPFATTGLLLAAASFILFQILPVNFPYPAFAGILLLTGLGMGMFGAPNQTGIMNSLPPNQRGAGAGMTVTFMSSAQVLSIGVFFTLMVLGLAASLPSALLHGLQAQGVSTAVATRVSHLPPVGSLFAAFLGDNPMAQLLGPAGAQLPHHTFVYLTGRSFFPKLISGPFGKGLHEAFDFAFGACIVGAIASLLRGAKYIHGQDQPAQREPAQQAVAETTLGALVD